MYTLKELSDKAFQELLDSGLSYKTVYGANWYIWNRLIRLHGEDALFEEWMVYDYCEDYFGKDIYVIDKCKLTQCEKRYVLAFNNLLQSNKNIPFKKLNYHYHRDFLLDHDANQLLEEYLKLSKEDGNSERTLENKRKRIRNFLIDSDFKSLTKESLRQYLNKRMTVMNKTAYVIEMRLIRRFLIFAYEKSAISKDILLAWPDNMSSIKNKDIPSAYTIEEIRELLISARDFKYEDNHLRNYAVLCLTAYSGIRASDVANLKFENIDWRKNEIRIIQHKTKRMHVIPLLPEIGNPIIEYIKRERRSSSKYVFTTEKGQKLNTYMITYIVNTYFSNAPFDLKGRHYGPHTLRHSIATNLINNSVSAFSVADVLGHSNTNCIQIYAKVDMEGLKKCVLEVPYRV